MSPLCPFWFTSFLIIHNFSSPPISYLFTPPIHRSIYPQYCSLLFSTSSLASLSLPCLSYPHVIGKVILYLPPPPHPRPSFLLPNSSIILSSSPPPRSSHLHPHFSSYFHSPSPPYLSPLMLNFLPFSPVWWFYFTRRPAGKIAIRVIFKRTLLIAPRLKKKSLTSSFCGGSYSIQY